MKLRIRGIICPGCGLKILSNDKKFYADGWIGHFRWCACFTCLDAYLVLFDRDGKFVSVVSNSSQFVSTGILTLAGSVSVEDIPF